MDARRRVEAEKGDVKGGRWPEWLLIWWMTLGMRSRNYTNWMGKFETTPCRGGRQFILRLYSTTFSWARRLFLICGGLVAFALLVEWYIVRRKLGVQKSGGGLKISTGRSKTHLMFWETSIQFLCNFFSFKYYAVYCLTCMSDLLR